MEPQQIKERVCLDKRRYADEPAARAVAMHMLQTGRIEGKKAWVYGCEYCRGWHITSRAGGNHLSASVSATNPWVPSEFAK